MMLKIDDILIPQLGELVEDTLETTRYKLKISREDFIELLKADNEGIFGILDNTLTDTVLNRIGQSYVADQIGIAQSNQEKIVNKHKEMFHYFFLFIHSCHTVFENLRVTTNKKEIDIADLILICLHGTLCRMADEIGMALSQGSTTSALARWRTFYEHVVVGIFLMDEDSPELFKKFADFSHRDARKQRESFDIHYEILKFPPLTEEIVKSVNKRTDELKNTYGKDFFDDYAWAKDALRDKGRPDFRKVEAQAGMSRYRPFYIWASNFTHPNFRALTAMQTESGTIDLAKVVIPKTKKESYVDPMQLTVVTFFSFLQRFLYRYSANHQYTTNVLLFRKIIDRLQSEF